MTDPWGRCIYCTDNNCPVCTPPHASYVIDRDGEVWKVVRDGGMVTRANHDGVVSAGIAWLERESGPLLPFDSKAYRRDYPRAE